MCDGYTCTADDCVDFDMCDQIKFFRLSRKDSTTPAPTVTPAPSLSPSPTPSPTTTPEIYVSPQTYHYSQCFEVCANLSAYEFFCPQDSSQVSLAQQASQYIPLY